MRTALVGFAGGLAGALMAVGVLGAARPPAQRLLRAEAIELVDEEGTRGLTLSVFRGTPMIVLYHKGERAGSLSGGDAPSLSLNASGGGPHLFISAGQAMAGIGLHAKAGAQPQALVSVMADGRSAASLRDGEGAVVWKAP